MEQEDVVRKAFTVLSDNLSVSSDRQTFINTKATSDYFRLKLGDRKVETFAVMYLDSRYRMIEFQELATGTVNETSCRLRAIAVKALDNCTKFIIVGHNHPSGDCLPSNNDKETTRSLATTLSLFDIELIDHYVVGRAPGFPCWSIKNGGQI